MTAESPKLANSEYQERLQAAFHTARFEEVVNESPEEAEVAMRLMVGGVERQIRDAGKSDPEWASRAEGYKRVCLYHLRIAKLAAKQSRRESHARIATEANAEWKDLLFDVYDFILEKLGPDTAAAAWITPNQDRTLHEWYEREKEHGDPE